MGTLRFAHPTENHLLVLYVRRHGNHDGMRFHRLHATLAEQRVGWAKRSVPILGPRKITGTTTKENDYV